MDKEKKQQSIYDSEQYVEWGGFLNEFLWICAGADRKILRQCPTDYAKYAGIGGTILFTALMAMLSGGYAMYFVFKSVSTAIAFGIFWGLLIFNLDRFIVNTMYSDGKVTISWQEFFSGLPRIIMAIFLGMVISTPLEMKIFEDRINSQLTKDNLRRSDETRKIGQEANKMYLESRNDFADKMASLESEKNKLDEEKKQLEDELTNAELELRQEGEGNAISGKVGRGPIYREKEQYRNSIKDRMDRWEREHQQDYERLLKNIDYYDEQIKSVDLQIQTNNTNTDNDIAKTVKEDGFCVRYEAFSNVKADNPALSLVSIIIMLLFIIIETAPTFFKMMIASGPYDDLLRSEMHRVRVLSDKRISDVNDEVNTEITISTQKNEERVRAEILANKKVMEQIAAAQAELLQTAIDKWREEELAKIAENPSEYIKTSAESNSI